jgi:hypothetical protein
MARINYEQPSIPTVKAGVAYVKSQGWQLSVQSMYRHIKEGKIEKPPWTKDDLDRYAARHLRPAEAIFGSGSSPKEIKQTAQELIRARKKKIKVEIETKQFELKLKRGEYIPRSEHVRAFNAKALLLRDAVYNFIYEYHHVIIDACKGDRERHWEVIEAFHAAFKAYWQRCEMDFIPWEFVSEVDNYVNNRNE